MYKLVKDSIGLINCVFNSSDGAYIPFDLTNTDYQTFKAQINAYADGLLDEAQLQTNEVRLEDAEGNLMTAEEAKAFVATLP